jgi:hypothetical protein
LNLSKYSHVPFCVHPSITSACGPTATCPIVPRPPQRSWCLFQVGAASRTCVSFSRWQLQIRLTSVIIRFGIPLKALQRYLPQGLTFQQSIYFWTPVVLYVHDLWSLYLKSLLFWAKMKTLDIVSDQLCSTKQYARYSGK